MTACPWGGDGEGGEEKREWVERAFPFPGREHKTFFGLRGRGKGPFLAPEGKGGREKGARTTLLFPFSSPARSCSGPSLVRPGPTPPPFLLSTTHRASLKWSNHVPRGRSMRRVLSPFFGTVRRSGPKLRWSSVQGGKT